MKKDSNLYFNKEYGTPKVEIIVFDLLQDVIRVSGDANDNDFGAGGLTQGGFADEN
jgi:hypothetical protein